MWISSRCCLLAAEKAQSVEVELLSSHREETVQLQKLITQREDDLHRTVQKYENVIQVRSTAPRHRR